MIHLKEYETLPLSKWSEKKQRHEAVVDHILSDYLTLRDHQHKNPVIDFLFEYYNFRPALLRRWTPGMDVFLEDAEQADFPETLGFRKEVNSIVLKSSDFPKSRLKGLDWILNVLKNTSEKPALLSCYGMHEWAMVYKSDSRQHQDIPLRFSKETIAEIVEERPPVCTHYDAYRFFTKQAKPMNKHELSRLVMPDMEQPGCLHTNMDLYKWTYKFYPYTPSDLILNCFHLALETRTLDMKASPYDLRNFGYDPVKIETESGRMEYREAQLQISKKAEPLRLELIEILDELRSNLI